MLLFKKITHQEPPNAEDVSEQLAERRAPALTIGHPLAPGTLQRATTPCPRWASCRHGAKVQRESSPELSTAHEQPSPAATRLQPWTGSAVVPWWSRKASQRAVPTLSQSLCLHTRSQFTTRQQPVLGLVPSPATPQPPQTCPEFPPTASRPSYHLGPALLSSLAQGDPHPASSACGCPLPTCCTQASAAGAGVARHHLVMAHVQPGSQHAEPRSSWGGGTVPSPRTCPLPVRKEPPEQHTMRSLQPRVAGKQRQHGSAGSPAQLRPPGLVAVPLLPLGTSHPPRGAARGRGPNPTTASKELVETFLQAAKPRWAAHPAGSAGRQAASALL